MAHFIRIALLRLVLVLAAAVPMLQAHQARAATADDASTTIRLIRLLIQKGILTQGQAASLLTQANGAPPPAEPRHRHGAQTSVAAIAPAEVSAAPAGAPPGEVRVTYVPQFVRDQIATEVRTQVLQQVQSQGWAKPDEVPDWIHRLTLYGDFRLRYQLNFENNGNKDALTGLPYPYANFDAIDTGGGYDTSGAALPPLLNVTENRSRYRVRARIGVHAQIADWITSDIRIATGNDPSPVSENQTLGAPGDFQKYAVYVDQAYLKLRPIPSLTAYLGREPNPYFLTDLMFYRDLNFDGVSAQYDQDLTPSLGLFAVGGAYPIFNTALNFSSQSLTKESSHDSFLLAAQAGGHWRVAENYTATVGAGYFAYSNISGKESAPCLLFAASDTCSTDDTIPTFEQYGNTVFAVRDIVTNASTITATPELYGLASHFGILDLHGRLDISVFDPIDIALDGEFVKNLAFNRAAILAKNPVNNFGSNNEYQGGDTAYLARVVVGYPDVEQAWQWNLSATYKSVASDAVLDAITDPDFHEGGTNAKGYILGAILGVANHTNLSVRWFSATAVSGPPNGNDVLEADLNAKF